MFADEPVIHRIKADLLGDQNTLGALPYYERFELSVKQKGNPTSYYVEYESPFTSSKTIRKRECWEQGFQFVVGTMGRNLQRESTI